MLCHLSEHAVINPESHVHLPSYWLKYSKALRMTRESVVELKPWAYYSVRSYCSELSRGSWAILGLQGPDATVNTTAHFGTSVPHG